MTKSAGNPFNEKTAQGFQEVIEAEGGECIVKHPEQATADAQVSVIQSLISQGVDSIAIAANDENALQAALEEAMDAGIKVSCLDSKVNADSRMTFVNQAGTEEIGTTLMDAVYDITGGEGQWAILSATSQATNQNAWIEAMKSAMEAVKNLVVMNVNEVEKVASSVDFVFSAVDMTKEEIKKIEEEYAKTETPVVSNNSAHRWTPDVPMVVPEINPEHYEVIKFQKERLGTKKGFVAVKPNCSIQSYAPVLNAWKEFEPVEVVATTYQAISGAGKTFKDWPEMEGNIIPYIGGEEEKSEQEPLRLWGKIEDGVIKKAELPVITTQCIRVPIADGHTAAVFVKFNKKPTKEQLIEKLINFKGLPQELELPSAPKQFIQYREEDNRM